MVVQIVAEPVPDAEEDGGVAVEQEMMLPLRSDDGRGEGLGGKYR